MSRKQLKISLPADFYKQLQVEAKKRKLPASTLARNLLAKEIRPTAKDEEFMLQSRSLSKSQLSDAEEDSVEEGGIMYLDDILTKEEPLAAEIDPIKGTTGEAAEIRAATYAEVFGDSSTKGDSKAHEIKAGNVTISITINAH